VQTAAAQLKQMEEGKVAAQKLQTELPERTRTPLKEMNAKEKLAQEVAKLQQAGIELGEATHSTCGPKIVAKEGVTTFNTAPLPPALPSTSIPHPTEAGDAQQQK